MDHFIEWHADLLKSVWATSQTTLRGGAANSETIDHLFSLLSQMIAMFSIVPEQSSSLQWTGPVVTFISRAVGSGSSSVATELLCSCMFTFIQ